MVRVTLNKTKESNWARLVAQKEKLRNIKYNAEKCLEPEEKRKTFLKLDIDDSSEEEDNVQIEVGSDIDYDESDVESNSSSN